MALTIGSALFRQHLHVGGSGLAASLPLPWYVGMVLLLVGLILAWSESPSQMAVASVAIVLAFSLSTAIVYPEPRYVWTAKHVGVVQYIRLHHSVNTSIDIYQAWPGLFAGMAWLCDVAGLRDPMALARWWPVFSEISGVVLVRVMAGRMLVSPQRCWLAGLMCALASDAFGQDYFSPQSAALLLALFAFCLTLRPDLVRPRVAHWLLWTGAISAIAVTHQITPYLLCLGLGVLVVFGFVRPWWLVLPPGFIAGGWALVHLSSWKSYVVGSQVGKVASNLQLTHPQGDHARAAILLISGLCLAIGGLVIGLLALANLFGVRRRWAWALAVCAASQVVLVLVTAYSGEGVNRVIIFALPWLAILAAGVDLHLGVLRRLLPIAVAPVLAATYLVSVGSVDATNTYGASEVGADRTFERVAPAGSALVIAGANVPVKSGERYNLFRYYGLQPQFGHGLTSARLVDAFTAEMVAGITAHDYYAILGPTSEAYDKFYGYSTASEYRSFVRGLSHSPDWTQVYSSHGALLYRLTHRPPTAVRKVK